MRGYTLLVCQVLLLLMSIFLYQNQLPDQHLDPAFHQPACRDLQEQEDHQKHPSLLSKCLLVLCLWIGNYYTVLLQLLRLESQVLLLLMLLVPFFLYKDHLLPQHLNPASHQPPCRVLQDQEDRLEDAMQETNPGWRDGFSCILKQISQCHWRRCMKQTVKMALMMRLLADGISPGPVKHFPSNIKKTKRLW